MEHLQSSAKKTIVVPGRATSGRSLINVTVQKIKALIISPDHERLQMRETSDKEEDR